MRAIPACLFRHRHAPGALQPQRTALVSFSKTVLLYKEFVFHKYFEMEKCEQGCCVLNFHRKNPINVYHQVTD